MKKSLTQAKPRPKDRRGIVVVLTGFVLTLLFAFVSMSVDSGRIVLTETQMQNAVDAAALAASQEITASIEAAGQGEGDPDADANSIAVQAARQVAADVAAANGVYIDPDTDVQFGKRYYDEAADDWPIAWDESPYNVVRVKARRTNADDLEAPDGELPLAFGWAVGRESVPVATSATAFVEARDLVLVLDFSGSMNDDSSMNSSLELSQVEDALDNMWDELREADPKWPGTNKSKFPADGFGEIDSYEGTYISTNDRDYVLYYLGLFENDGQTYDHLFPQSGRASDGTPNGQIGNSSSYYRWRDYVSYVKGLSGTYHKKYGYRTLMSFLQHSRPRSYQSEDLWRTSHYPFTAVKNGTTLFLNFLEDLDFGDEVGLVSYATWAEWEDSHNDGEVSLDISDDPINANYDVLDTIQRRHQAGHYDSRTGMGDGILKGREMLVGADNDPNDEGYSRYGARPTMIVMTDGLANEAKSGWSLPDGFDWNDWTDYDGDGQANYTTSDWKKQYAFWEATECVKRGITLHSVAVGAGADTNLMKAIAFAGGGVYINVPGGSTIAEMESQMLEAFGQIAAKVPPAQLVYELEVEAEPQ